MRLRRLGALAVLAALCGPAHAGADGPRMSGFPEVAAEFADFFRSLPHGDELASLRVQLVAPEEVSQWCGQAGMTACYLVGRRTIVAPGPELQPELLAHEYGHHLAAHRRGAFDPVRSGPPHWASEERVCAGLRGGLIGRNWANDPAEAWADVYTRLTYPDLPWRLSEALRPDERAYAAAVRDVRSPLQPRARTFRGRFGEGGSGRRSYRLRLRMDGPVQLRLQAEDSLKLDLRVVSGRRRVAFTAARALRYDVCRTRPVERLVVEVRRRSGTGGFTLRARYP